MGVIIVVLLAGGLLSAIIASHRGVSAGGAFVLGVILPIAGILYACLAQPAAGKGLIAYRCPRCNARSNVDRTATSFECWQCHYEAHAPAV